MDILREERGSRTHAWQLGKLLPYRLATPASLSQYCRLRQTFSANIYFGGPPITTEATALIRYKSANKKPGYHRVRSWGKIASALQSLARLWG